MIGRRPAEIDPEIDEPRAWAKYRWHHRGARRGGGMDDRSHLRNCWEPSSSANRHEVVHADALHDEKPACGVGLTVHIMRGLRGHRAALARQETIDLTRCPCLDH